MVMKSKASSSTINFSTRSTPWLGPNIPLTTSNIRLFCFPYAGGGTHIFRDWHNKLPHVIKVCPIQLTGREERISEPFYVSMPELIETMSKELEPYLHSPFAIFGHSMGAKIGFEFARAVRRKYELEPIHLFVSGASAPQMPNLTVPIYHLPYTKFIDALNNINGTPHAVLQNAELMEILMPRLRADFELIETYKYVAECTLTCPITALGGLQDSRVSKEQLEGWREQTVGDFHLRMMSGDHFYIASSQFTLLQLIAKQLHNTINNRSI
jgi:medium-chain acyl-[acyl-carrier-protein] hydrolase